MERGDVKNSVATIPHEIQSLTSPSQTSLRKLHSRLLAKQPEESTIGHDT